MTTPTGMLVVIHRIMVTCAANLFCLVEKMVNSGEERKQLRGKRVDKMDLDVVLG